MGDQERYEGLPSKEELKRLPRWVQVAFAARCAERVRPLPSLCWDDAPLEHLQALEMAVDLAKRSAREGVLLATSGAVAAYADDAKDAAARAAESVPTSVLGEPVSGELQEQYCANFSAAVDAASVITAAASVAGHSPGYLQYVVENTVSAFDAVSNGVDIRAEVRRDYELLKALAEREGWTDESPVDPDLLGPLWAEGEPEGWPVSDEASAPNSVIKLEIAVPAGMSPAESKAFEIQVVRLLASMSQLHAELGGTGLRILDDKSSEPMPHDDPVNEHAPHDPCTIGGAS